MCYLVGNSQQGYTICKSGLTAFCDKMMTGFSHYGTVVTVISFDFIKAFNIVEISNFTILSYPSWDVAV